MLSSEQNKLRFSDAINAVSRDSGIGTLNEKILHAVIKHYIEPDSEKREIKVGASVADVFNSDGITEIQTRSFEKLIKKLPALLETSPVTVVLPIPHVKWVSWLDKESGELSPKRKSPKTGRIYDCLYELSKIRKFLADERLTIKVMLIDMDEYRNLDGWGKGGKRGSSRYDRIPLELFGEYVLNSPSDYLAFIPEELEEKFTLKDYMKLTKIKQRYASAAIYILRDMNLVELTGKQGRENLYQLTSNSISVSSPSITQNPPSAE